MPNASHTYDLADAVTAAAAVLPHMPKDDVTPVITTALVDHYHWLATDRFTVAQYAVKRTGDDADKTMPGIMVPREAVEWVAKIVLKKLRAWPSPDYALTISQSMRTGTQGDVVVAIVNGEHVERSQSFDVVLGNFPPVGRLVAEWKPATEPVVQMLGPVHLEKVTGFAKRHYPERPLEAEPGHSDNPGKPGPMRVTIGSLVALVQPNLKLA